MGALILRLVPLSPAYYPIGTELSAIGSSIYRHREIIILSGPNSIYFYLAPSAIPCLGNVGRASNQPCCGILEAGLRPRQFPFHLFLNGRSFRGVQIGMPLKKDAFYRWVEAVDCYRGWSNCSSGRTGQAVVLLCSLWVLTHILGNA